MAEHSIELLGQKFSYPSTWQGTFAVLIVCSAVSFMAYALDPEQIDSYRGFFNTGEAQVMNEQLSELTRKQSEQIAALKEEIQSLSDDQKKQQIAEKLAEKDKEINQAYTAIISDQERIQNKLSTIIARSPAEQKPLLSQQQGRISQQIIQLKQQQQQQQLDYR